MTRESITSHLSRYSKWYIYGLFFCFALETIYCNYVFLYTQNVTTGLAHRQASLNFYLKTLSGTEGFPYQWRILASYLVWLGQSFTGLDPNIIDAGLKVVFLFLAALFLYWFSRFYLPLGTAALIVFIFFIQTTVGLSEGYTIYTTNDMAFCAGWFCCVYLAHQRRFLPLALIVLVITLAREVTILTVFLVLLSWRRKNASLSDVLLTALSFAVPFVFLRLLYPAPVGDWAFWGYFSKNIPFLQSEMTEILNTLRYNFKALLLYNVLLITSIRYLWRRNDPFLLDLAVSGLLYIALIYWVGYVREVRLFLPLAILINPIGVKELLFLTKEGDSPQMR